MHFGLVQHSLKLGFEFKHDAQEAVSLAKLLNRKSLQEKLSAERRSFARGNLCERKTYHNVVYC